MDVFPVLADESVGTLHEDAVKQIEAGQMAFSMVVDGRALAVCGITMIHNGVGDAWGYITPEAIKYPITLHKGVIQKMRYLRKAIGYHRVQMCVKVNDPVHSKWALALGFELEGVMKKYGDDGTDYIRYAKTYENNLLK